MAKRKRKKIAGIPIKTPQDIAQMRVACETASTILQQVALFIEAGKTTKEVDAYAAELIKEHDCKSAFLNYRGFPGNICISPNEEVVHGIGSDYLIKDGDIISIDIGVVQNGWIGDNATTVPVGNVDEETKKLLAVTEQSLFEAIQYAKEGCHLGEICGAVQNYVESHDLAIVREFVGHGVGRNLHEEPQVPNYRMPGKTPLLREGMVLAIEPMVNVGTPKIRILKDGWTVITEDRKPSAHFEHTVHVTKNGPDILTARPRTATAEQLGITL